MRECLVMKIRNIQCSTTEMAGAWLELWPGQFPIKGLQRVSTTRAMSHSFIHDVSVAICAAIAVLLC